MCRVPWYRIHILTLCESVVTSAIRINFLKNSAILLAMTPDYPSSNLVKTGIYLIGLFEDSVITKRCTV